MGYFLIERPDPPVVSATTLAMTALFKFQQKHVIQSKPVVEINPVLFTVTVKAGDVETYTWEELGFNSQK